MSGFRTLFPNGDKELFPQLRDKANSRFTCSVDSVLFTHYRPVAVSVTPLGCLHPPTFRYYLLSLLRCRQNQLNLFYFTRRSQSRGSTLRPQLLLRALNYPNHIHSHPSANPPPLAYSLLHPTQTLMTVPSSLRASLPNTSSCRPLSMDGSTML